MPPKKNKKVPKKVSEKPPKKVTNKKKLNREQSENQDSENDIIESESENEDTFSNGMNDNDYVDEDDILDGDGNEIDDEDEPDEDIEEHDDMNDEVEDNNECIYRFSKKKMDYSMDDDIDEDYFSDEDVPISKEELFVANEDRTTKAVLTKYERVRILGERSRQLASGAKAMVKGVNISKMDPKQIAKLELEMKTLPLIIIRPLPSGKKEKWRIEELEIVN